MTILILSILFVLSASFNLFQYLLNRRLNAVILALYACTKASHEFMSFLVIASTADRPSITIMASGVEASEMYQNRLNNMAFALQDIAGIKRRAVCDETDTNQNHPMGQS